METLRAKEALIQCLWHEEVESLHKQLANIQASHDSPTFQNIVKDREIPEGYQANNGCLPDFVNRLPDGQVVQVPFIKYLEGGQFAASTLGGKDEHVFLHSLFATPIVSTKTYPDVLPNWFVQLMGSSSLAYAMLISKASYFNDWGLSTDIERYHNLDEQAIELGEEIARLQLKQANVLNSIWLCHPRLARAEAGRRLMEWSPSCMAIKTEISSPSLVQSTVIIKPRDGLLPSNGVMIPASRSNPY